MTKAEKQSRTVSQVIALTVLVLYTLTALFGDVVVVVELVRGNAVDVLLGVTVGFADISAAAFFGFYERKSERENVLKIVNAKNEYRLKLAQEIFTLIRADKLSPDAISLVKTLISDSDTSVQVGGFGGVSTIDETTYSVPQQPAAHDMRGEA